MHNNASQCYDVMKSTITKKLTNSDQHTNKQHFKKVTQRQINSPILFLLYQICFLLELSALKFIYSMTLIFISQNNINKIYRRAFSTLKNSRNSNNE